MRPITLAIAALIASSAVPALIARNATPTRAAVPEISGTLTRDTFELKGHSLPSWTVELTIVNKTAGPVTIGPNLAVLATSSAAEGYAAVYVSRRGANDDGSSRRMAQRYGFDWGVEVPAEGAIWPLGAFATNLSTLDRLLLVLSAPSIQALPGGGYGSAIPAGESRIIKETVLFPFDSEIRGERDAIVVVPPVLRAGDGRPVALGVLRIPVSGVVPKGRILAGQREDWSTAATDLARIGSEAGPQWRRVLAVNWLAEFHSTSATDTLVRLGTDETVPLPVRHPALLNLGLTRANAAAPQLIELLQRAAQRSIRYCAIAALGDMGDPTAAPAVRPFIANADDLVARAAMEAAGAFKDVAAVPDLMTALANSKMEDRHPSAANALGEIATPEAIAALVAMTESRDRSVRRLATDALARSTDPHTTSTLIAIAGRPGAKAREDAIHSLAERKVEGALPVLRVTAADGAAPASVRVAAIRGLADMKDTEARTSLAATLDGRNTDVYEAGITAMLQVFGAAALPEATAALRSRTPKVRSAAASALQKAKVNAVAQLWEAYRSERDRDVGQALADALIAGGFSDEAVVPLLVAGLDKANPLWLPHVRLLRHLTKQTFGPEHRFGSDKERSAAFDQWRAWCKTSGVCR